MPKKHSRNTCKILFLLRRVRITESHLGSTKAEITTLSVKPFFSRGQLWGHWKRKVLMSFFYVGCFHIRGNSRVRLKGFCYLQVWLVLLVFGSLTRIVSPWRKDNSRGPIWSYLVLPFFGLIPLILRGSLCSNERMCFSFLKKKDGPVFSFLTVLIWDRLVRDVKCLPWAKKQIFNIHVVCKTL